MSLLRTFVKCGRKMFYDWARCQCRNFTFSSSLKAKLNKLGRLPLKGDTLMELRAGGLRPYLQANTRSTYTLVLLPLNKSVLKFADKADVLEIG
jgi:hypothetical protein